MKLKWGRRTLEPPTIKQKFLGFQGGGARAELMALLIDDRRPLNRSPLRSTPHTLSLDNRPFLLDYGSRSCTDTVESSLCISPLVTSEFFIKPVLHIVVHPSINKLLNIAEYRHTLDAKLERIGVFEYLVNSTNSRIMEGIQ